MKRLAKRHLSLSLRVQLFEVVQFFDEQLCPVQEVLQGQVLARHRLRALRRKPQHGE